MGEAALSKPAGRQGYRWFLLFGIWLVYFCFGLVAASMAPLIPVISAELGISNAGMGAILGAWPLVYIAAAIPCGVILDRLTARWSLLVGSAIVGLSALLRGFAWDELSLFAAVGLFGIGGPLISVGAPKLTARWFDGRDRGSAIGIYTTGPALGSAASLALMTSVLMPLFDQDWRMVMVANAAVAFAAGAAWFLLASHPLADPAPAADAIAPRAFDPGTALALLAKPSVQVLLVMGVGIFLINHGFNNWLPEILRAKGLTAAEAGLWASLTQIVGIAGSLVVPRYAVAGRRLALIGLIFAGMAAASLLLLLPAGAALVASLVLLGIARTSATAIVMLLLLDLPGIDRKRHGLLGGLFFVAAEIGGVLGPTTIGLLSDRSGGFASSLWALSATGILLVTLAGLLARVGHRGHAITR
ncbi:MFS transporter [Aquibium sp. ELW1220]|uniref:MFS transporter n=1 Tax=Aquibium sp. ELW1220 TaxID=2976766 RepID=UPI0025B064C3|nr:MFS transporter [Aquibium sp. ELW1220]MDN2580951.1 MFS transporter [Aquibium sp. ELW1220]